MAIFEFCFVMLILSVELASFLIYSRKIIQTESFTLMFSDEK